MVFNTDFTLQVARSHQADLLRGDGLRLEPVRPHAVRQRIGAWIVRLGHTVEGRAAVRPNHAWQA